MTTKAAIQRVFPTNFPPSISVAGVTLGGQLRRKPNAFNLVHQLQFLQRGGMSAEMTVKSLQARGVFLSNCATKTRLGHIPLNLFFGPSLDQAHDSVSAFAQAYCLGEKESAAAVNLLRFIPGDIKDALTELVRTLGLNYQQSFDAIKLHHFKSFDPVKLYHF